MFSCVMSFNGKWKIGGSFSYKVQNKVFTNGNLILEVRPRMTILSHAHVVPSLYYFFPQNTKQDEPQSRTSHVYIFKHRDQTALNRVMVS